MSSRYQMVYDEELDADIHRLIEETPKRRRSERLRQLIRLGLAVEKRGGRAELGDERQGPELTDLPQVQRPRNRLRFTAPD